MKYLIYSRVSTENQDVGRQIQNALELIARKGGVDVEILSEDDLSSSIPMHNRPMLQRMLGMMNRDVTIVVYSIDRLAREFYEQTYIRHLIKERGATLISCTQEGGKFMMNIHAAVSEEEKDKTIQRINDTLKYKQKCMERVGTTWYGYKLDETKLQLHNERARSYGKPYLLIPHEEEYRNLQLMLQWHKEGFTLYEICNKLTALGYLNRSGKPFQLVSVSRILRREENRQSHPRKSYRKTRKPKQESLALDDITLNKPLMIPSGLRVTQYHQGNLNRV